MDLNQPTFIWDVPTYLLEDVLEIQRQFANLEITEGEFIDRLRTLGFPRDATWGDHVHIRLHRSTKARSFSKKESTDA